MARRRTVPRHPASAARLVVLDDGLDGFDTVAKYKADGWTNGGCSTPDGARDHVVRSARVAGAQPRHRVVPERLLRAAVRRGRGLVERPLLLRGRFEVRMKQPPPGPARSATVLHLHRPLRRSAVGRDRRRDPRQEQTPGCRPTTHERRRRAREGDRPRLRRRRGLPHVRDRVVELRTINWPVDGRLVHQENGSAARSHAPAARHDELLARDRRRQLARPVPVRRSAHRDVRLGALHAVLSAWTARGAGPRVPPLTWPLSRPGRPACPAGWPHHPGRLIRRRRPWTTAQ